MRLKQDREKKRRGDWIGTGNLIIVRWRKVKGPTGWSNTFFIISRLGALFSQHNLSDKVLPAAARLLLMEVWKNCLSTSSHTMKRHRTDALSQKRPHTLCILYTTKKISSHGESSAGLQTPLIIPPRYPLSLVQRVAAVLLSCAVLKASIFTAI